MSFLTASADDLILHHPGERGGRDIGILGGAPADPCGGRLDVISPFHFGTYRNSRRRKVRKPTL